MRFLNLSAERLFGRPDYVAAFVFVSLVSIGSLITPDTTSAAISVPSIDLPSLPDIPAIPNPVDALDPAGWIVEGFKALLEFFLGDKIDELGENLINLLLAVPLLTDERRFAELNEYRTYVSGAAWGILGLSLVISSIRYLMSAQVGNGAYEALTGFIKTSGAIVGLLLFPPMFEQISRAINAFTSALVINPIVGNGMENMLDTISMAGVAGGGVVMLVGVVAIIMAIVLLVVKVIVTALLAVLFVASPLAIAVWPIEELSHYLRSLLQTMFSLLIFPIIWALCFGTLAVLSADALFPGDYGSFIDSLLGPVITLAALVVAFRLPFAVLNQGMAGSISPRVGSGIAQVRTIVNVIPSGTGKVPVRAPASPYRR